MNWRPVIALACFGGLAALVAAGADFDLWSGFREKEVPVEPIDWKPREEAPAAAPAASSMDYVKGGRPLWSEPVLEETPAAGKGPISFAQPKLDGSGRRSAQAPRRRCPAAGRWVIRLALEPSQEVVFDQDAPVVKRWCPESSPWHSGKAKACFVTEECCQREGWDCSRPTRTEPLPESLAESRRR